MYQIQVESRDLVKVVKAHERSVNTLRAVTNGLLSGGSDGTAKLWDNSLRLLVCVDVTKIINVKQSLTFLTAERYDEIMRALQSEEGVKDTDVDEDMASLFDESDEETDDMSKLWSKELSPREAILNKYRRENERKAELERELEAADDDEEEDEAKMLEKMHKDALHGTEIEPGLIVVPEIVSVAMHSREKHILVATRAGTIRELWINQDERTIDVNATFCGQSDSALARGQYEWPTRWIGHSPVPQFPQLKCVEEEESRKLYMDFSVTATPPQCCTVDGPLVQLWAIRNSDNMMFDDAGIGTTSGLNAGNPKIAKPSQLRLAYVVLSSIFLSLPLSISLSLSLSTHTHT